MSTEVIVAEMLQRVEAALVRLDAWAREIHVGFWRFLNDPFRDPRRGKRLRLRMDRGADGHVRGFCWTKRLREPVRTKDGRFVYATRRLRGGLRRAWVAFIAHSIDRLEGYRKVERERVQWTRSHHRVVHARMKLKLWLVNGWAPRATEPDWARARALASRHMLGEPAVKAMAGAIALGCELKRHEGELRAAVEAWWRHYDSRPDVPFRPHVSARKSGGRRVEWRWKGWVCTKRGNMPFGKYIPERPTVKWMAKIGVPRELQRELSREIATIQKLRVAYDRLADTLGDHRRCVGAACAGLERRAA